MTARPRHLLTFGLLVLALAGLLGWTEITNWRELARLRRGLRETELESAAVEFQAHLLARHGALLAGEGGAATGPTAGDGLGPLYDLLRERQAALAGPDDAAERALVTRLGAELERYGAHVGDLLATPGRRGPAELASLQAGLDRLLALTDRWKELHRAALAADLAAAQRSLDTLRLLLFGSALALLALAGLVAALVHHGLLAPLRQELVVRDALLVRQEKLASLGVLAAGVAHEIRNPLTAIKARLFSQTRRLAPGSPEHADGLVIKDEIQRLEIIVRDVLQFARPGEPVLVGQSASAFLREIAGLMRPELEKRAITLTVEPGEELLVALDPAQMKQVLINLVQNAADSIGKAGRVVLRARRTVLPRASRRTEAVALEVEDDGRGVPPEVQARLFDPFFTTKAAGTGLGLSIAERIAQKHGGTLAFQTRPGRGATFRVILPMNGPLSVEANGASVRDLPDHTRP